MQARNFKNWISFAFVATFLSRLYHIAFPVLGWHSWRQADTASIARNFFENGFNILQPQVNWGGTGTGFVEAEFQIYPFIVSLFYALFGVSDFWGRIVSVIFSVLAVYGLYLLVRKFIDESTALWSAFIYAVLPLNIYFGRAFMPESMMLMCSVYGIYFFSEWLDKERTSYFIYALMFVTLAALLKLPTLYIGLPLFYLAWKKYGAGVFVKPKLILLAVMILALVFLWYYHAHQLFLNNGVSFSVFGDDKWGSFRLLLTPRFYHELFLMSIAERHLTYPGFVLLLVGLFLKRTRQRELLFDFWLISVLIFFIIAGPGNLGQEYYQLPFNLPAAVFIGKALQMLLPIGRFKEYFASYKFKSYFALLCVVLILTLSFLRVARFMNGEDSNSDVFKMGSDVMKVTAKDDKIITVCDGNPVYLYHADRKGWAVPPAAITEKFLEERIRDGAKVITGEKGIWDSDEKKEILNRIFSKYTVIHNDAEYFVVLLKQPL